LSRRSTRIAYWPHLLHWPTSISFMVLVSISTMINRTISFLGLIGLSALSVSAQRMADIARFEVASVKPSRPIAGQPVFFGMESDPGRFRGSLVTLADLVGKAYGMDVARISGGPSWVSTDRYDDVATLAPNASQGQIPILLQTLLAERFGLTVRRDTKMIQVYAMVLAKGGPKDRGHHAGVAPPVHHGDDPKGLFLRRVGDQIFTHRNEAQGPSGEVGAFVAGSGGRDKGHR